MILSTQKINELQDNFWKMFFDNKKNKEVYNWLNYDNGGIEITIDGAYWIQLSWSGAKYPNTKAMGSIMKWAKRNGLTYLYNL